MTVEDQSAQKVSPKIGEPESHTDLLRKRSHLKMISWIRWEPFVYIFEKVNIYIIRFIINIIIIVIITSLHSTRKQTSSCYWSLFYSTFVSLCRTLYIGVRESSI
jgi:hypothetical protein